MNKELESYIHSAGDLPTMPMVATKVMQLIESGQASAEELARVVASDPAVAARVLKISNSAFYGCQRQIQTLSHAIVVLGQSTLKSLVIAASVKQVYKPFGLTEKMLWEHSFGAGLAARIISATVPMVNCEEAFLCGLFHDIGKIIMNTIDKGKFQSVIEQCYNEGARFQDVEKSIYPFTHDELGGYVIKKWNFPEILMYSIMEHHRMNFDDDSDALLVNLTAVVNLADAFCQKLGIGERIPQEDLNLHETKGALRLGLRGDILEELLNSFTESFEQDKNYFVAE